VETLIFLIKFFIFLKRLAAAFFVIIIFKPGYAILRFIFHKVIIKAYCYYLSFIKKLGWVGFRSNFFSFLFNQKLVHVFVIGLTIIIVFSNFITGTKAGVMSENAHKTIIANLVKSEFGEIEDEELIEEYSDEESAASPVQQTYLVNLSVAKSQPHAIMQSPDEIEAGEDTAALTQGGAAVVKPDIATTKKTKRPRTEIVYYTVRPGDSVSTIAAEFEISVNTILW